MQTRAGGVAEALVLFLGFMVLINICLLAKQGDVGKVRQFFGGWGPLKVGEVFFERTDARLVPGTVKQDSAVVYSSKDDLYSNDLQHLERKAKPIIAKPRTKILETRQKSS